ncbi:YeeE/YedE thiosulfate transporter family protein [Melioribacter sp. OK-6-Me]|uniref:YeeE/YedE thiosulfate transporter family protein n=1 Tax=unclassified Melioribacter TaxID=2627329 RepID=UPI003ED90C4E
METVTGISPKLSEQTAERTFKSKPYSNPYLVGFGLGLVLLSAFVIMGRGLGASGAASTLVAVGVAKVAPEHASQNEFYKNYLGDSNTNPLKDWLVFEVIGVAIGGFLSGTLAHRVKKTIEKGPNVSNRTRLIYAFVGGAIMGFGAKLARGCTSGQALTGGALLSLGSWVFMLAVFAGGYLTAYFVRRQWL